MRETKQPPGLRWMKCCDICIHSQDARDDWGSLICNKYNGFVGESWACDEWDAGISDAELAREWHTDWIPLE